MGLQALDMTLASEAEARRDVAKALAAREERAGGLVGAWGAQCNC